MAISSLLAVVTEHLLSLAIYRLTLARILIGLSGSCVSGGDGGDGGVIWDSIKA